MVVLDFEFLCAELVSLSFAFDSKQQQKANEYFITLRNISNISLCDGQTAIHFCQHELCRILNMSESEKRKRSRVQGGWAAGTNASQGSLAANVTVASVRVNSADADDVARPTFQTSAPV